MNHNLLRIAFLLFFNLLLSSASLAEKVSKTDEQFGISIFLEADQSLEDFFLKNRVLVSAFQMEEDVDPEARTSPVTLIYPSVNREGRSPLYSHRVTVVELDGVPLQLKTIDPKTHYLVLRFQESPHVYELVGTAVIPEENPPFDYFENKKQYHWVETSEESPVFP